MRSLGRVSASSVLLISLTPSFSPAMFLESVGIAVLGKLVGKGLIDDAKAAANEVAAELDKKLDQRIIELGNKADDTVRLAGKEAKASVAELNKAIQERIDQACGCAKAEREAFFCQFAEARSDLVRDLDVRIAHFNALIDAKLDRVDEIASRNIEGLKTLADQLALEEIGKVVRTRPPGLYREVGLIQGYRPTGEYNVVLIGRGLGGEDGGKLDGVTVTVDDTKVESKFIGKPYTRVVSIPAGLLLARFKDSEWSSAKLKVSGKGFDNERVIQLLPRFPYRYAALAEIPGHVDRQRVYVNSPGRSAIEAAKQLAVPKGDDEVNRAIGKLFQTSRERLAFGESVIDLPAGAAWKEIKVEWFTGNSVTLTPDKLNGMGIRVARDGTELRITAQDPFSLSLDGLQ